MHTWRLPDRALEIGPRPFVIGIVNVTPDSFSDGGQWPSADACIINDVTALADANMAKIAAKTGAGLILMHMQGTPATMQHAPHYDDVVSDIARFFEERMRVAAAAGVEIERIALDPGIGFG